MRLRVAKFDDGRQQGNYDSVFHGSGSDIQQEEHQPLARLQGLSKLYKRGEVEVEALKRIDLTLNRQEFIFVIGPSGSGKTTLLNLLVCIDVPTSGQLSILGRDIVGLSDNNLADFRNQHIGYISEF